MTTNDSMGEILDQTVPVDASIAGSATVEGSWAAVSVAIVIPFLPRWAKASPQDPADAGADVDGWQADPWRLQGLWKQNRDGARSSAYGKSAPDSRFSRERAIAAIRPVKSRHLLLEPSDLGATGPGWEFEGRALERFDFAKDAESKEPAAGSFLG